jgi:hypothetical protein
MDDDMEARLMARINDAQERILEPIRGFELQVAGLTEIAHTTNTLLATMAGMMTDLGRRLTDLEKKG